MAWLLLLGGLLGLGCVPLPARVAAPVTGAVVDARSGAAIANAWVVVRFEGRLDRGLPLWEPLGHREARSDASGRFRTPALLEPGVRIWPWLEVRARVESVLADGYACAGELAIPRGTDARVALVPAAGASARESCRPVAASPRQTPGYVAAWRALHTDVAGPPQAAPVRDARRSRSLEARLALGFGSNCSGPVLDVALAPGGEHALLLRDHGDRVERELHPLVERVAEQRAGDAPGASLPAVSAPGATASSRETAFSLQWAEDARSGGAATRLRIAAPDAAVRELALPGNACGRAGRFGRPQQRIAADGRTALDLRWVEDGCHAIAIDLETGAWRKLEAGGPDARTAAHAEPWCSEERHLPRSQLRLALPGYADALELQLHEAGLDPAAAFSLLLDESGATTLEVPDADGSLVRLPVARLPLETPLRAIHIGVLAPRPARLAPDAGLDARPDADSGQEATPGPEPL